MGQIRRQSIQSSILFYIGAAIGFVNKILIFTNFLTPEEVGLANILLTTAMMYAQLSALGYVNVTLKYFPYFRNRTEGHHGFLFLAIVVPLLGFAFITGSVFLFRPWIEQRFLDKSPLFVEYFYYIIPLGFFTLYFNVFEGYLRSLFKTVMPVLLKEVAQRILITVSVTIYALGWVNLEQFVMIYVAMICSVTLLMVGYLVWLRQLHIRLRFSWRVRMLSWRMFSFGLFAFSGNISTIIVFNIDSLMLADFVGMASVGIYTTIFYVTALMQIPAKALQRISTAKLAELWKERAMDRVAAIYKRTSLINLLVGTFLFLGMVINMDNLFSFMQEQYRAGTMVLILIGLNRLFEMVTGLNGFILLISERYRWDLVFVIIMVIISFLSNLWLIPIYEIDGAALATLLSFFIVNVLRLAIVGYFFRLQPFTWKMLPVILAAGVAYGIQYLIPVITPFYLDLLVRSAAFTVVYWLLVLVLRVSPDVDQLFQLVLKRVGWK